jgi:hypothetical protein
MTKTSLLSPFSSVFNVHFLPLRVTRANLSKCSVAHTKNKKYFFFFAKKKLAMYLSKKISLA